MNTIKNKPLCTCLDSNDKFMLIEGLSLLIDNKLKEKTLYMKHKSGVIPRVEGDTFIKSLDNFINKVENLKSRVNIVNCYQ